MAEYKDREHYIPIRKSELVDVLCRDLGDDRGAAQLFEQLSALISATFHYEYYKLLEELKDQYAPFDPDSVTQTIAPLTPEAKQKKLEHLFERLAFLMDRANFKRLRREDLEKALLEVSEWGVSMDVDLSIFEHLHVYARGDTTGIRYSRRWPWIWKKLERTVAVYRRLALFVKLKPDRRLPEGINTDAVFLKAFKEIPKADLEMLLPGARLTMPGLQRLKLGGSIVSGGAGVGYTFFVKLAGGLALLTQFPEMIIGLLVALFGYGYKQYYGYQSTRNTFHLRLTQSLYYQTIGNNLGVLFHLLDEAEEQECREALLAYYYLWRYAGEAGWGAADLDDYVEMDLERLAKLEVDFEIGDALAKLERLQLVMKNGDRYAAVPIEKALEVLDCAWDNYFKYNTVPTPNA